MASTYTKQVMNSTDVNRSVTRLAHEILERNGGADQLLLVGILTRGEPLAKRLQSLIQKIAKVAVPMGSVNSVCEYSGFRRYIATNNPGGKTSNTIPDNRPSPVSA